MRSARLRRILNAALGAAFVFGLGSARASAQYEEAAVTLAREICFEHKYTLDTAKAALQRTWALHDHGRHTAHGLETWQGYALDETAKAGLVQATVGALEGTSPAIVFQVDLKGDVKVLEEAARRIPGLVFAPRQDDKVGDPKIEHWTMAGDYRNGIGMLSLDVVKEQADPRGRVLDRITLVCALRQRG